MSYGRRRPIRDEGAQVSHGDMESKEFWGVKPVHLLLLRGHLVGVVDNEQWSAGEASAIAEVALPKLPVQSLKFTRTTLTRKRHNAIVCVSVWLVRSTRGYP